MPNRRIASRILCAGATALALGCATDTWPQTRIGLNEPPPGTVQALTWPSVSGASAYQVTVSLDRGGLQPVARGGFNADPLQPVSTLSWSVPHPAADRPYFWTVRAYDRPDPQGLVLNVLGPYERVFRPAGHAAPAAPSPVPTLMP